MDRLLVVLTSEQALAMPIEKLCDMLAYGEFLFKPTQAEAQALQFIGERYEISSLLLSCIHDEHIQINPPDVLLALDDDSVDRVPMLSDDTGLQRVVWAVGAI
jgi:hypothetical protein